MLESYAAAFYRLSAVLEALSVAVFAQSDTEAMLRADAIAMLLRRLTEARELCVSLGLDMATMTIDRILSSPESSFTHAKTLKMIEELSGRVQDHLRSVYFMHVPKGKADYYRTYPFDTRVSERFPSATFDIEEAGKCYALARHTACVMHLMRVVEIGLRTYGTALGVTASIAAARPNWNDVLRVANDEILRLNRSGDATWTPEKRSFFEGLHPYFHAIRIAWRNTTMHVENRYDEERAGEIFNAVKSWMRYMSTHLDEAGTFTP